MEYVTAKPNKPTSNISELVSKFVGVCRLRSVGVFSDIPARHNLQKSNIDSLPGGENSSDGTEDIEYPGEKVHPEPTEVPRKLDVHGDAVIMKLFDMILALKIAYLQLQQAHIPYEPQKIVAADELFFTELEKIYKFKREYKEKHSRKVWFNAAQYDLLQSEIKVKEALLESLKFKSHAKDSEIVCLRQELCKLEMQNRTLAEKVMQMHLEKRNASILSFTVFYDAFQAVSKSIHDFAKPVISLLKASGWNLDIAAKSIEEAAIYCKRSDRKYAFEAYIARRMFHEMTLKSYDVDYIMRFADPIDALVENPNSEFAKFCGEKYLLVVHPMMEASFFGNLDHRSLVLNGKHPRTPFYQLFAKMAKWIWVLQGSAASVDPNSVLFTVSSGSKYSDFYMESVEGERPGASISNENQASMKVEFMVMPGFQIGKSLVKSRVYISNHSVC